MAPSSVDHIRTVGFIGIKKVISHISYFYFLLIFNVHKSHTHLWTKWSKTCRAKIRWSYNMFYLRNQSFGFIVTININYHHKKLVSRKAVLHSFFLTLSLSLIYYSHFKIQMMYISKMTGATRTLIVVPQLYHSTWNK